MGERSKDAMPRYLVLLAAHICAVPQVGSHYHFIETNAALVFDRAASYGMRLNVPAGSSVRFEPGDSKTITLATEHRGRRTCMYSCDELEESLEAQIFHSITCGELIHRH